ESRLSFVRMFKSQMGMTPQEYRDLELDPASSGLA
ncbi:MAG: hypothetical protein K0R28_3763, partial [Paenibacillus sp.]|nr:hypothetical protein [Paenibacillus sp.]